MLPVDASVWEEFLKESTGKDFKVLGVEPLERDKVYAGGFGDTIFITLEDKRLVAKVSKKGDFGRNYLEDRIRDSVWTFSKSTLPKQPKQVAIGSIKDGKLIPFNFHSEPFVVSEEAKGKSYHLFLSEALKRGNINEDDRKAALELSDYLVDIHQTKEPKSSLYKRHIIDVVGSPEGLMGVVTYLWNELTDKQIQETFGKSKNDLRKEVLQLKKKAIEYADSIEDRIQRSSQIHGDFHPFENIRFENYPEKYWILDRSRAEFGEPADDVVAMWMNYLNHALLDKGNYSGPFMELGNSFLDNYLRKTNDHEMLEIVQPFAVWRGLVISTPKWYPNTPTDVRKKIFNFMRNVSEVKEFDPKKVNAYLLD